MAKNTSNKHDTIYIYIYIYISEINRYNRSKKIIQIKTTLMLLYIYSIQMNHCNPIYQCMSADNQIWLRLVIHCFDTDYGKWWTVPFKYYKSCFNSSRLDWSSSAKWTIDGN